MLVTHPSSVIYVFFEIWPTFITSLRGRRWEGKGEGICAPFALLAHFSRVGIFLPFPSNLPRTLSITTAFRASRAPKCPSPSLQTPPSRLFITIAFRASRAPGSPSPVLQTLSRRLSRHYLRFTLNGLSRVYKWNVNENVLANVREALYDLYSFVSEPFSDRVRNNAGAYNMYGLLLENQKLFHQAEKAFERLVIKGSLKKHLLKIVNTDSKSFKFSSVDFFVLLQCNQVASRKWKRRWTTAFEFLVDKSWQSSLVGLKM